MTRKARNAQRRAVYRYYRGCGYSAKFAANMRNRSKPTVWEHYHDTGKREGRKAPSLISTKPEKSAIRKELKTVYGLSTKMAYQWSRLKEETLQFRLANLEKYVNAIMEVTGRTHKEALALLTEATRRPKDSKEFWESYRELYDGTVGFPG